MLLRETVLAVISLLEYKLQAAEFGVNYDTRAHSHITSSGGRVPFTSWYKLPIKIPFSNFVVTPKNYSAQVGTY